MGPAETREQERTGRGEVYRGGGPAPFWTDHCSDTVVDISLIYDTIWLTDLIDGAFTRLLCRTLNFVGLSPSLENKGICGRASCIALHPVASPYHKLSM